MKEQYGADPILLKWIYNNTLSYPETLDKLAKIKRLDSRKECFLKNTCKLPSWLEERENDFSLIGRMTGLRSLRMDKVCVKDFSFLKFLKNLQTLDVQNTNFSDCSLLLELPALKAVYLPPVRNLKKTQALDALTAKVEIKKSNSFYHDEDFVDIRVVDGKEVVLEYEEGAQVRCVEVSFIKERPSEWMGFGTEANQENNWACLSWEEKQDKIRQFKQAIQDKQVKMFLLSFEPWGEGHYLLGEFEGEWAAFAYVDDEAQVFYQPYNSRYKTVEILAPVELGGQTPVPKRFALNNMELAAEIAAYFLENGQLKPGTKWAAG